MDVKVHSIHFKADQKLIDFINDKVITTKYNSDNDIIFKQEKKNQKDGINLN